jgi:3-hydroxyisobutyrate dehydrogenase-like beta-hydroxyacid dehydrogenase
MSVKIGLLHPGNMGAALATCLHGEVYWASDGRSQATAARATEAGITDLGDLDSLVAAADVLLSVCPPAAARDVARQVSALGFGGLYVDLNAVAPATAIEISTLHTRFVDGGIIGPPPSPGEGNSPDTRIYFSGEEASEVAGLFIGSRVKSRAIGPDPGQASALKMTYAAWTKGSSALLLSIAAVASQEGVLNELMAEWDASIPELRPRLDQVSSRIGRKAWRFVGEMEEIARTYADAGLPDGFHLAAAGLYSRLSDLKDHESDVTVEEIMRLLTEERSPPKRLTTRNG